jgi:tetratricopeptide (TPR) repeat protein
MLSALRWLLSIRGVPRGAVALTAFLLGAAAVLHVFLPDWKTEPAHKYDRDQVAHHLLLFYGAVGLSALSFVELGARRDAQGALRCAAWYALFAALTVVYVVLDTPLRRYYLALLAVAAGVPALAWRARNARSESHLAAAREWWRHENFTGAERELETAIRLNPRSASAYALRGMIRSTKKRPAQALDDLNKAIALDPKMAPALGARAKVFGDMGQFDRAIGDLTAALAQDPRDAGNYSLRGAAFAMVGLYGQAWKDAIEAERLGDPAAPRLLAMLASEAPDHDPRSANPDSA